MTKKLKYELWEIQGLLYILVGTQLDSGLVANLFFFYGGYCLITYFLTSTFGELKEALNE